MLRVLFVCVHNSARSQMAEAYLNHLAGDQFQAESGGLEPGSLNEFVVESLQEDGIDISDHPTNSVFDYFKQGRQYDVVVTVCSPEVSEKCPIFPGRSLRFNWPFPDPAELVGERDEVLVQVREIRDQIRKKIEAFISEYNEKGLRLFVEEQEVS